MNTQQHPLPRFPVRAAAAVLIVPFLAAGLSLFGFGLWNAPACGAGLTVLLMALCILSPEIIAFPANVRGELGHRLELARCAGTSWFADIRAQGRSSLLEIAEMSLRATQQRDRYRALFAAVAALHLVIAGAILAAWAMSGLSWNKAIWSCGVSATAAAYLAWLTVSYRRSGAVAPDRERVFEAANLHMLCDQERHAELVSLIKKV